jgi:hypothetical protein
LDREKGISEMKEFREMLRESNFFARAVTFGMIPLFWRICMSLGRWRECDKDNLMLFGVAGIWIGVVIGHNLYYRWIFPEKRRA